MSYAGAVYAAAEGMRERANYQNSFMRQPIVFISICQLSSFDLEDKLNCDSVIFHGNIPDSPDSWEQREG